jgi:hypothetical protein
MRVAGAAADPQFGDAAADGFDVSRVAGCQSVDPDQYPRRGAGVLQFLEPLVEGSGSDDLDDVLTVVDISGRGNRATAIPSRLHDAGGQPAV